mgnify:CR=1 FL=1
MNECNCRETYKDDSSMRFKAGDKVISWDGEVGTVFHVSRIAGTAPHDRLAMDVDRDAMLRREGNQSMFTEAL